MILLRILGLLAVSAAIIVAWPFLLALCAFVYWMESYPEATLLEIVGATGLLMAAMVPGMTWWIQTAQGWVT